jgi:hypothetical protein
MKRTREEVVLVFVELSGMDQGEVVGATGFEPAIFRSQSGRDTRLRYAPTPRFYIAEWIAAIPERFVGC